MPRRVFAFVSASLLLSTLAAVEAASCTPVESSTVVAGCTTSEPSLSIVSPVNGACWPVSSGGDAYVPVVVSANNFLLRPPGQCTGCANCGHLRLRVNGIVNNEGATSILDVMFEGQLPDHFGEMTLTVDLVDDCGRPWQPMDGGPPCDTEAGADFDASILPAVDAGSALSATVTITTAPSCGGDAGAGDAG